MTSRSHSPGGRGARRFAPGLGGLAALFAAQLALADPCCLVGSPPPMCQDLPPTQCTGMGGVAGYCIAGQACGSPAPCTGPPFLPIADVKGYKVLPADVAMKWWIAPAVPDPAADRYDVWYVTDKTGIPAGAADSAVTGCTPTMITQALHAGAIAGTGGTVFYYEVIPACGTSVMQGACCIVGNICTQMTRLDCELNAGAYAGDNVSCSPDPCKLAACCGATGCLETSQSLCTGVFHPGMTCTPSLCGTAASGACCTGATGTSCTVESSADCLRASGTYQGDGTVCSPNPCALRGACCLTDGTCVDGTTRSECTDQGGMYAGDGTDCGAVSC